MHILSQAQWELNPKEVCPPAPNALGRPDPPRSIRHAPEDPAGAPRCAEETLSGATPRFSGDFRRAAPRVPSIPGNRPDGCTGDIPKVPWKRNPPPPRIRCPTLRV